MGMHAINISINNKEITGHLLGAPVRVRYWAPTRSFRLLFHERSSQQIYSSPLILVAGY
jgi:hypothetical protein